MTIVIPGSGGSGTLEELTSSTLDITAPTGPTTDLEIPDGLGAYVNNGPLISGPPTSAVGVTWGVGQVWSDRNGIFYVCIIGGNPGTWQLCAIPNDLVWNGTPTVGSGTDLVELTNNSPTAGYLFHLTSGPNSVAGTAMIAMGTDGGACGGLLISCKNPTGAGFRLVQNGGSGNGIFVSDYSISGYSLVVQQFAGSLGAQVQAVSGYGFDDGVSVAGSTAFSSALAAFTVGDVGAALSQSTTVAGAGAGCIPGGATVAAVVSTTVAAGSNGAVLPQSTINLASTASLDPTGSIVIATSLGNQIVTYTSVVGNTIQGCAGGTGTLSTGGVVTQMQMSVAATTTSTVGVFGVVAGRVPALTQALFSIYDTINSATIAQYTRSGLQITQNDTGTVPLLVTGKAGTTANIFAVFVSGGSSPAFAVGSNGGLLGDYGLFFNNFLLQTANVSQFRNYATSASVSTMLLQGGVSGVTGDYIRVNNSSAVKLAGINYNGGLQPGTAAGVGCSIYSGSGAPNVATSVAGDVYFRTDTPSTALQRLYVATAANTWTGVL